jgi:hypothetical protein
MNFLCNTMMNILQECLYYPYPTSHHRSKTPMTVNSKKHCIASAMMGCFITNCLEHVVLAFPKKTPFRAGRTWLADATPTGHANQRPVAMGAPSNRLPPLAKSPFLENFFSPRVSIFGIT